jgi:hypothetical protein
VSAHTPEVDATSEVPSCPKCNGPMWDNREGKRNPKAPDFKCKDRNCDGVIWPPRAAAPAAAAAPKEGAPACPICGGAMWDDRATKRNPRAPDFKCKDKPRFKGGPGCEGVIWPPRDGERRSAASGAAPSSRPAAPRGPAPRPAAPSGPPAHFAEVPPPVDEPPFDDEDELPF